jgi:hypothetical protein
MGCMVMAITDYYVDLTLNTTSTFKGYIAKKSSEDVDLASDLIIKPSHTLYCPITVSLSYTDVVNDGIYNYKVVSLPINTVNRNHHYKYELMAIFTDQKLTLYNGYVNTTTRTQDYHKTILDWVYWRKTEERSKFEFGADVSDSTEIFIPYTITGGSLVKPRVFRGLSDKTGYFTFDKEDIVVRDEVSDDLTFSELQDEYGSEFVTITSIETVDYGDDWAKYWKLLCR